MPLPNRVRPDGTLFADPARGTFYGNRGGRFHDPTAHEVPTRVQATRQWLCCVLSFKGRKRKVWGRGYTELFFCDEVTAFAAGHRPCMECRRQDALAYRAALVQGLSLPETPFFPEIDRILDADRLDGRTKRLHRLPAERLPDGTMLLSDNVLCREAALGFGQKVSSRRQGADVGSKLIQMVSTVNGIAPSHSKHRIQQR